MTWSILGLSSTWACSTCGLSRRVIGTLWDGNVGHDRDYLGSIGVDALGGETEDHREERKIWQVNGGVVPPTDKGGAVSAGNSNTG